MRLAWWQESTTSTILSSIASSSPIFTTQWWTIWDFYSSSFRLEPLTISHMHRSAVSLSRNYFTLCFQLVLQDLSKAETVWSIRFAISCSWFFNWVIFYLIQPTLQLDSPKVLCIQKSVLLLKKFSLVFFWPWLHSWYFHWQLILLKKSKIPPWKRVNPKIVLRTKS